MVDRKNQPELRPYIEQWGMLFEQLGSTRIAGRAVGWLLVCEPPHQTAREIADAIGASISSISATTRILTQSSMVERVGMPGERSAYFRIKPGTWSQLMRFRLRHIGTMRELADEGLRILSTSDERLTERLREIGSYCAFVEREMPAFLARWEDEWKRENR